MTHEFIIVGAGAYGCAVAYHLARNGYSVRVVEAGRVADGASGGGGKRGVRGNRRDLRELHLMQEAYDLWPQLSEELGASTGYVRTGGFSLIEKESVGMRGGLVAAETIAQAQSDLGVPTEFWGSGELRELLPQVSSTVKGALHAPLDGVAGHEVTTNAYAHAARKLGVEIIEGQRVSRIRDEEESGYASIETEDSLRMVATNGVLIATNATTPKLLQENFNYWLPTWTTFPQAIWLKSENPLLCPYLIGHDSRVLSLKVNDGDTIQLSGGWRGRADPVSGNGLPIEENVAGSIHDLESTFTGLGALERIAVDTSRPETATVDQIPIVDRVPRTNSIFYATGWNGHGWALLPAASRHIANYIVTKDRPRALDHLAADRFGR